MPSSKRSTSKAIQPHKTQQSRPSKKYQRRYKQYRDEFAALPPDIQEEENKSILLFIIRRLFGIAPDVTVIPSGEINVSRRRLTK